MMGKDDSLDVFSVPRPVGGAYTMVDPLRHIRQSKASSVQFVTHRYLRDFGYHPVCHIHGFIIVLLDTDEQSVSMLCYIGS